MAVQDQSLKGLVRELIDEIARLIRGELRLMQAEGQEKVAQIQTGVISIISGLLVAFCALLILLQAAVIALAERMEPWMASVIVGVAVAIVGWILISRGQRNLKAQNLVPERTLKSMRDTRDMVEEKAA